MRPVRQQAIAGALAVILAGCGGRAPNPIPSYQPGDERRTCMGLQAEISANEVEIARLVGGEDATGKNIALGVTGALFIVPWFFMDFKDGERIEIQALRRRNNYLRQIAFSKECTLLPARVEFEEKPTKGMQTQ